VIYIRERFNYAKGGTRITRELVSEFAKDWKKLSEDDKKQYANKARKYSEDAKSQKDALEKHRIPVNNSRSAL
jgi:mRNA-degrading endonuclease RelE of RelBE toxin-antitoxin system